MRVLQMPWCTLLWIVWRVHQCGLNVSCVRKEGQPLASNKRWNFPRRRTAQRLTRKSLCSLRAAEQNTKRIRSSRRNSSPKNCKKAWSVETVRDVTQLVLALVIDTWISWQRDGERAMGKEEPCPRVPLDPGTRLVKNRFYHQVGLRIRGISFGVNGAYKDTERRTCWFLEERSKTIVLI